VISPVSDDINGKIPFDEIYSHLMKYTVMFFWQEILY